MEYTMDFELMPTLDDFAIPDEWTKSFWPVWSGPEAEITLAPENAVAEEAASSQPEEHITTTVAVAFNMASNLDVSPPNVIIVSSDGVSFFAHWHKLSQVSNNGFGHILPAVVDANGGDQIVATASAEVSAVVLNITLHAVYGKSCEVFRPSFEDITSAMKNMKARGMSLQKHVVRSQSLYNLFLGQAPLYPLEAFTVAAENGLEDLAVAISPLLLPTGAADIPDELATRMGAIYFKRLMVVQFKRIFFLHGFVIVAPYPHATVPGCDYASRQALARAWSLAIAALALNIRPEMSGTSVELTLGSLETSISCKLCKKSFHERVQDIVRQWVLMERGI